MNLRPNPRGNNPRGPRVKEEPYNINERIRAPKVRVVGDDIEASVMNLADALALARSKTLDLVEISPNAEPPVCKIVDYSKFKYEQKKKQKELKAKTHKVVVKEIRFGPNTDDHDFDFKLKHAINFLKEGNKVKACTFRRPTDRIQATRRNPAAEVCTGIGRIRESRRHA
jgi:translation initiation factor IF-3